MAILSEVWLHGLLTRLLKIGICAYSAYASRMCKFGTCMTWSFCIASMTYTYFHVQFITQPKWNVELGKKKRTLSWQPSGWLLGPKACQHYTNEVCSVQCAFVSPRDYLSLPLSFSISQSLLSTLCQCGMASYRRHRSGGN